MLGVLLESHARRPQRWGGMALSVSAHLAIISAVTAATVRGTPVVRERITPVALRVAPSPARAPVRRRASKSASGSARSTLPMLRAPTAPVLRIPLPNLSEPTLPAAIVGAREPVDPTLIGIGAGSASSGPRSIIDGAGDPSGGEWRGSELLMRIVTSSTPRYPLALRQAGIEGRVLVRFVVDSSGRIDARSVQVLQSTHELFTRAVRDALAGFRFRPAEMGRRRVSALAEMPFEFRLTRTSTP